MATAAAGTAHHQLKLVIDPNSRRVLFAQASGEAIEFLHSLLASPHVSLPFDGATRNACIANVYDSVEKLRSFAATANISRGPLLSTVQQRQQQEERFFVCAGDGNGASSCGGYVADKSGARCPFCGGEMAVEVPRGDPGAGCSDAFAGAAEGPGAMKGADLTCMLTDDLTVMPAGGVLSVATSFMMGFIVRGMFQETVVCLGYTEAMEILETSLQSSTVLTDQPVRLSFQPSYFQPQTVFFSHNKSANSTFSHDFLAKRTGRMFSSATRSPVALESRLNKLAA